MNDISNVLSINQNKTMDFYEAIKNVLSGKKIHKLEWQDRQFYGLIDNETLKLHKPDGKLYQWIVNVADISGNDWIIL